MTEVANCFVSTQNWKLDVEVASVLRTPLRAYFWSTFWVNTWSVIITIRRLRMKKSLVADRHWCISCHRESCRGKLQVLHKHGVNAHNLSFMWLLLLRRIHLAYPACMTRSKLTGSKRSCRMNASRDTNSTLGCVVTTRTFVVLPEHHHTLCLLKLKSYPQKGPEDYKCYNESWLANRRMHMP